MGWDVINVRTTAKKKVEELAKVMEVPQAEVSHTAIDNLYREVIGDPDAPQVVTAEPEDSEQFTEGEKRSPKAEGPTFRL